MSISCNRLAFPASARSRPVRKAVDHQEVLQGEAGDSAVVVEVGQGEVVRADAGGQMVGRRLAGVGNVLVDLTQVWE